MHIFWPYSHKAYSTALLRRRRSIEFSDGEIVSAVDTIILATGFKLTFPFFTDEYLQKFVLGDQPRQKASCERGPMWLYESIFPPKYPSMAFVGFAYTLDSTFVLSDIQNRYITSIWTGAKSLPSESEITRYLEEKRKCLPSTQRVVWEPNQHYFEDLAYLGGFYPSVWAILKEYDSFGLVWKTFFAPMWPANYRLVGPGK
ncbi:dimethylaniline monooxygenase [Basidiobolus ranarum]|uniref:Dimethylaniline monooxygenase n=1 Tax=Basidiobolus ranarum TaxID=34480 RepID=A0ABR2WGG1_9FUNG